MSKGNLPPDVPNDGEDRATLTLGVLAPIAVPAPEDVSALAERFYDLFPDAPPRGPRDLAYFGALLTDFGSQLDVDEELKRFAAWTLDRGSSKSPRSSLRDWLRRARTFRQHYPARS